MSEGTPVLPEEEGRENYLLGKEHYPRTETRYVPIRRMANRRILDYAGYDATPTDDRVIDRVVEALSPTMVTHQVQAMLDEFKAKDRTTEVFDDETGAAIPGTLVLAQGLEVEVQVRMARRAMVMPPESTEQAIEYAANTVLDPSLGNILISVEKKD